MEIKGKGGKMFYKGQYVSCSNKGVCTVEEMTTLNISGVDKEKKYYILKPCYMAASTVYIPVDSAAVSMRPILTAQEAEELIAAMPDIPLLIIENEKLIEQNYKAAMKSNKCEEWVRLAKTIYDRKQKRLLAGKKETSLDSRYYKQAEEMLYGELAIALQMSRGEMCEYITKRIQDVHTVS